MSKLVVFVDVKVYDTKDGTLQTQVFEEKIKGRADEVFDRLVDDLSLSFSIENSSSFADVEDAA